MGARGDEFCHGVGEGRVGGYVENGERVFAVGEAAGGEDDADEVDAGVLQERRRGGLGEEVDVGCADVADDIRVGVEDG